MLRLTAIIFFATCCLGNIYGQTRLKPCLYIADKNRYILSETISFDNGYGQYQNQTYNSLFIWQNDKAIRIVFNYLKRMPGSVATGEQQLFTRFIPPFKKYTVHTKAGKMRTVGKYTYGGTIVYGKDNEDDGYNYTDLLKTVINNWNKTHNPLADQFGAIMVEDADPHVLFRNKKRKQADINNLPILLRSTSSDSLYLVAPYVINIYRLDNSPVSNISDTKRYKLYSTVSFTQDGPTGTELAYWNGTGGFIGDNTLPYLYDMPLQLPADSLLNMLSALPMARPQFTATPIDITVVEPEYSGDAKTVAINKKRDSIAAARKDSLQKIIAADCFGMYQYCPECLNDKLSKLERIKKHCPVTILPGNTDENWSYVFSTKSHHYFKVESPHHSESGYMRMAYVQRPGQIMPENYLFQWLLMSPGVGYWMTDVTKFSMKYFIPDSSNTSLKLNNRPFY